MLSQIRVSRVLFFLFVYTFALFPFGPGIEGFWSTSGVRSAYALFFELIVVLSFYLVLTRASSLTTKIVFKGEFVIGAMLLTGIKFIQNSNGFEAKLSGDELVYVGMPGQVFKLTQLDFDLDILIRNEKFLAYVFIVLLSTLVLTSKLIKKRNQGKARICLPLIIFFILFRNFFQIFTDFSYQYPVAFTIPLNFYLIPDLPVVGLRLIWVFSVFLLLFTSFGQLSLSFNVRMMFYFSVFCVFSQDEVEKFLLTIEPITFSIIAGSLMIFISFNQRLLCLPTGHTVVAFAFFRPTSFFWLLLFLSRMKDFNLVRKRRVSKKNISVNIAYSLLFLPVLLHSTYQILLGMSVGEFNRAATDVSVLAREVTHSFNESYGALGYLTLTIFALFIIYFKKWETLLAITFVTTIFLLAIPQGAISSNKYLIELFVPVQIVTFLILGQSLMKKIYALFFRML